MPALLCLGNTITSGGLGVECLQPSLDVSGMLCVFSSCISSSSSVQVSDRMCKRLPQTFDSSGTMLDEGSLASHSSQHVGRCSVPQCCPIIKDLLVDILVSHMLKGLPYMHLTLWLLRDVFWRQGFSSSVCHVVMGATQASMMKVYQQCWKEWAH